MKKIAKYGGIVLALIFIYFNYIHEPSDDKINKPIETRDIEYRAQGYLIKAGKQLNNKDTIETLFENVEAIYDGMVVTADKGRLTKEENLHLEGNIRGKADNGWTFEADKASYFNATKMITAEGNIKVINSETGAVVKGDKLKTDSKLANLDVTGNVNIAVAGGVLTADRASYSDNDKIIKIRDNIRLKGLADSKDNKSQYVGKFTQVDYDTKRREIIASGPLEVKYMGTLITAERFVYNEQTLKFVLSKNVKVVREGTVITMDTFENDIVNNGYIFNGKITGTRDGYKFTSNVGTYSNETKILTLQGDIVVTGKEGERLEANLGEYNTETGYVEAYGSDEKPLIYTSPREKITANYLNYNTNTKDLEVKGGYTYNSKDLVSDGEYLKYNDGTRKGSMKFARIKTPDYDGSADSGTFDLNKEDYALRGNVEVYFGDNSENLFRANEVISIGAKNEAQVIGAYTVENQKEKAIFSGSDAVYNTKTSVLTSPGDVELLRDGSILRGKNLVFNNLTKEGAINSRVDFYDKERDIKGTGERATFKLDEFARLEGANRFESPKAIMTTRNTLYNFKDKKIYTEGTTRVDEKGPKKGTATMQNAIYDTENAILEGENFVAKQQDKTASGDYGIYYANDEIVELKGNLKLTGTDMNASADSGMYDMKKEIARLNGNIKLQNKDMSAAADSGIYYVKDEYVELAGNVMLRNEEMEYTGSEIKYSQKTGDVDSSKPFTLRNFKNNYTMTGAYLDMNVNDETFRTSNARLTTPDGSELNAKEIDGRLKEKIIEMKKGVVGKFVDSKKKPIHLKGNNATAFLRKVNEKNELSRIEVKDNVYLDYETMAMKSNFIEYNMQAETGLSKGPTLFTKDDEQGSLTASADSTQLYMGEERVALNRDVTIKNISSDGKIINSISKSGTYLNKEKKMFLEGDVKIDTPESFIQADRVDYNLGNETARASGDVRMDYKKGE